MTGTTVTALQTTHNNYYLLRLRGISLQIRREKIDSVYSKLAIKRARAHVSTHVRERSAETPRRLSSSYIFISAFSAFWCVLSKADGQHNFDIPSKRCRVIFRFQTTMFMDLISTTPWWNTIYRIYSMYVKRTINHCCAFDKTKNNLLSLNNNIWPEWQFFNVAGYL